MRARRGWRVLVCLTAGAAVALVKVGQGQQPSSDSPALLSQSAPQTGGPRRLWPQRPGPSAALNLDLSAIPPQEPPIPNAAEPEFIPNEVLVQFVPDATDAARVAARAAVAATDVYISRAAGGRLERLTTVLPVPDAIEILQRLPGIEFAEPNWIVHHYATSDDPHYTNGSLWGMYGDATSPANQFGSQAGEQWAAGHTGSSTVYVAVIDEGIDVNHPDLAGNIWTNPFDPVDGIDNDGNGRIDDVHGWDFFNNDNSVYDGSPAALDIDSHGTHVAGTIGARGGNGTGVAGVNWDVTIISAKFLGPDGGSSLDAAEALDYLVDLKTRHGLNIVATNNSWGGGGYSEALHRAIIRAAKEDILFIAAAGNASSNNDTAANYPSNYATDVSVGGESAASYDAVIAVASITSAGAMSSFSNYGATTVDIGAPGSGIISTTPQNGYLSFSGTSMATPHVAGAVALYKSMNTGASAATIRGVILAEGIATSSLAGKTVTGDRLNVGDFTGGALPTLSIDDVSLSEGNSGTKNATFTVTLSATKSSDVMVNYATGDVTALAPTKRNTSAISIPSSGNASPYPSEISFGSGLGTITDLTVTLTGFSHTWPNDVDVLLVGPTGQTVILMSDVGSSFDVSGLTFTLDDSGSSMPTGSALSSGTFKPTNSGSGDTFASPAPVSPYGTTLAGFIGTNPEGTWKLFVVDDTSGDSGAFSGGWSITLETNATFDYVSKSGTLTIPAGATTQSFSVTVNGDTAVESSETFKVTLSGAAGATIADAEGVATIRNDDFTDSSLSSAVIKVVHITELRTAINDARAAHGLGAFSFTDTLIAQSTVIKAIHISQLREALEEAYEAAEATPPMYTDPTITPGVTTAKAAHITELRNAVANVP